MTIAFDANAWEDYLFWQTQDRKTLERINQLIADVLRDPFAGIGKPEPLKHILSGAWSRRIDDRNRAPGVGDARELTRATASAARPAHLWKKIKTCSTRY